MKKLIIFSCISLPILFFVTIACSSKAFAADNVSITFSDALTRLYSVNEKIMAASEEQTQRDFEEKAAIGLFFPKISLNAAYARFNDDLGMDVDVRGVKTLLGAVASVVDPALLPIVGGMPNELTQVVQKKETFALDLSLTWPIFTGGKIYAANKAAKLYSNVSNYKFEGVKSKLGADLAKLYFGVRLANEASVLRKELYDTMQDHYDKAVKMENAGMLAKVERMHAEVALADAKRAYEQSLREADLSNAALHSILNIDGGVTPETPLFIVYSEFIPDLADFQDAALKQNSQIKQLNAAQELAKVGVMKTRSDYFPEIVAFGTKSLYNYNLTTLAPDWSVGVVANFTIFEGLSRVHKVQAAKAASRAVQQTAIRAAKDIKTLVEEQYITMQNARADYEAVQSTLAFTEEYLRARRKAFLEGMATSLDVVDAELALSNAKMSAVLSAYKFDLSLAQLLETAGRFGEFEEYLARSEFISGL